MLARAALRLVPPNRATGVESPAIGILALSDSAEGPKPFILL
jgi:hypothetical protein